MYPNLDLSQQWGPSKDQKSTAYDMEYWSTSAPDYNCSSWIVLQLIYVHCDKKLAGFSCAVIQSPCSNSSNKLPWDPLLKRGFLKVRRSSGVFYVFLYFKLSLLIKFEYFDDVRQICPLSFVITAAPIAFLNVILDLLLFEVRCHEKICENVEPPEETSLVCT